MVGGKVAAKGPRGKDSSVKKVENRKKIGLRGKRRKESGQGKKKACEKEGTNNLL